MSPRVAETVARVTAQFADTCYQHGHGCCQSIISYKVLPVLARNEDTISPYVEKRQSDTNTFIERLMERSC